MGSTTTASTRISSVNTFINLVFNKAFGVSFTNSIITNTESLIDKCSYAECTTTTCGSICGGEKGAHHRNAFLYAKKIYEETGRPANTIYIAWDYTSRKNICNSEDASHSKYESCMACVVEVPSLTTKTRGITVPSGYIDGQPVINIFEPYLDTNIEPSMKLVAAHEMAHVMGIGDSYGAGGTTGHELGDSWTCIMKNFGKSSDAQKFIDDITTNNKDPFCSYCKGKLNKVIKTRYFPAT